MSVAKISTKTRNRRAASHRSHFATAVHSHLASPHHALLQRAAAVLQSLSALVLGSYFVAACCEPGRAGPTEGLHLVVRLVARSFAHSCQARPGFTTRPASRPSVHPWSALVSSAVPSTMVHASLLGRPWPVARAPLPSADPAVLRANSLVPVARPKRRFEPLASTRCKVRCQ